MDAIDKSLLKLLQKDATLTQEQLSEEVGASVSAVQRRLKRLVSAGVIKRIAAIVDQAALGRPLSFIVSLEIERKEPAMYAALQRWLANEDAVQQAYNVTGAGDFVIVITARTVEEYDELMDAMLAANPNVKKFNTSVVLRSFKQCLFVPTV